MDDFFKIRVNNHYSFNISKEEVAALDVIGNCKFHVLNNHQSISGEVLHGNLDQRRYEMEVNANRYQVEISDGLDQLISEMGLSAVTSKEVNEVKAPMPGMILEVMVKEGQHVKQGDYLLVLEAMKMENTLTAPRDGLIKTMYVEKGQTVDKNQLLLELGEAQTQ